MDLSTSKVYRRVIDSVRVPLEHFVSTGLYDPFSLEGFEPEDIADFQVRRACRQLAKELKRPFIRCYNVFSAFQWDHNKAKWVKLEVPDWNYGYVEVPKRQYLAPLVAPLLLAAPEAGSYVEVRSAQGKVLQEQCRSLWRFRIRDRPLWDSYYQFMLSDPDCRKARRLTA